MNPEENKAIVRRFVATIPNKGDLAAVDELLASGFALHFPGIPMLEGTDVFEAITAAMEAAFPDLVETIDDLVAEDDRVVERFTLRGTHLGEFMGIAPTGRSVSWAGIAIYRLADERIAECWVEPNLLGLAVQIGLPRRLAHPAPEGRATADGPRERMVLRRDDPLPQEVEAQAADRQGEWKEPPKQGEAASCAPHPTDRTRRAAWRTHAELRAVGVLVAAIRAIERWGCCPACLADASGGRLPANA